MDIFFQLFWLFFILSVLSPYFQQQWLLGARTRKIAELERRRKAGSSPSSTARRR